MIAGGIEAARIPRDFDGLQDRLIGLVRLELNQTKFLKTPEGGYFLTADWVHFWNSNLVVNVKDATTNTSFSLYPGQRAGSEWETWETGNEVVSLAVFVDQWERDEVTGNRVAVDLLIREGRYTRKRWSSIYADFTDAFLHQRSRDEALSKTLEFWRSYTEAVRGSVACSLPAIFAGIRNRSGPPTGPFGCRPE